MKGAKQQPYFSRGWKERKGQNSFLVSLGPAEQEEGQDSSKKRKRSVDGETVTTVDQLFAVDLGTTNGFDGQHAGSEQASSVLIQHFFAEFAQGNFKPSGRSSQLQFERHHLRTVLWAKAGESLLLYNTIVLLAARHYSLVYQANSKSSMDSKILVLTLLNEILADPSQDRAQSDEVIASVAILAGLDFCYGDREAFKYKISELDRIVKARGGVESVEDFARLPLCAAAVDLARFISADISLESECKSFPPRIGGIPENFTLPAGFRYLQDQCYLRSEIWEAVKPLAIMAIPSVTPSVEPLEITEEWLLDPESLPYICCFSPFQSHADDVVVSLAHDAVRLGCLSFIQILKSSASQGEGMLRSDPKPAFESYSNKLAHDICSDTLCKSVFADLTLWALCSFCTLPGSKPSFKNYTRNKFVLSLLDELKIHNFEQLMALMSCFLYLPDLQNLPLRTFWDLLAERRDAEISTGTTESLQQQMAATSRFDKRVLQKMDPSRPALSTLYL